MTITIPDDLERLLIAYCQDNGITPQQAIVEMLRFFLTPTKDKLP